MLDGVLGGDDGEGFGQRTGVAVARDLVLLHRLEQSGLRFGRCSVDLIGEEQIGEHRAVAEPEVAVVIDELAQNVGRHQVRSELHSSRIEVQSGSERLHQQRLGRTRNALEQNVPFGQQRDEQPRQHAVLADHHLGHLITDGRDAGTSRACRLRRRLPTIGWLWRDRHRRPSGRGVSHGAPRSGGRERG